MSKYTYVGSPGKKEEYIKVNWIKFDPKGNPAVKNCGVQYLGLVVKNWYKQAVKYSTDVFILAGKCFSWSLTVLCLFFIGMRVLPNEKK